MLGSRLETHKTSIVTSFLPFKNECKRVHILTMIGRTCDKADTNLGTVVMQLSEYLHIHQKLVILHIVIFVSWS